MLIGITNNRSRLSAASATGWATLTWLIAVIVSPVIMSLGLYVEGNDIFYMRYGNQSYIESGVDYLQGIFLFAFFGGMMSIPNLFIFMLFNVLFGQANINMVTRRFITQLVAISMTYGLFYVLDFMGGQEINWLITSYCLGLGIGIWFLPVKTE